MLWNIEVVSKLSEYDEGTGEMKEGLEYLDVTLVADEKAPVVAEPCEAALDLPAFSVTAQGAPVLLRWLGSVGAMRADEFDLTSGQTRTERVGVVPSIRDEALGTLFGTPASLSRHANSGQSRLGERHFRRGGRLDENSQRKTRAVCHHHKLAPFAPLGLSDAEPPFLAGVKVPSTKASDQSNRPWASSSERNARHRCSQISSSCQSRNLRQQVLELGYTEGRSRHRAPVLRTHRIPSMTWRSFARGRPVREARGRCRRIRSHIASLMKGFCIPSFSHN